MSQTVLKQVSEIQRLSLAELRERWRALFGTDPPAYRRAYMVKRLSYRLQELAHGGISDGARARLRDEAERLDPGGARAPKRQAGMPVPGTMLVREWHGERHEATVTEGGFEYRGRPYRSLTAVAQAITGQHWNGRLFFGLRKPERRGRQ